MRARKPWIGVGLSLGGELALAGVGYLLMAVPDQAGPTGFLFILAFPVGLSAGYVYARQPVRALGVSLLGILLGWGLTFGLSAILQDEGFVSWFMAALPLACLLSLAAFWDLYSILARNPVR